MHEGLYCQNGYCNRGLQSGLCTHCHILPTQSSVCCIDSAIEVSFTSKESVCCTVLALFGGGEYSGLLHPYA